MMETKRYKTTMKCGGCVEAVAAQLNQLEGIEEWKVDITSPDKTLSVTGTITEQQLLEAVAKAGFKAEPVL